MNWYPRYTGDYARDTAELTMQEHGAFNLLLDHYYATETPLPESMEKLHRITKAFTQDERDATKSVIKRYFKHAPGIGYHNKKAEEVIATQSAKHDKAVKKARVAAIARWEGEKDAPSNATSMPQAMPQAMLEQCHPEPEPDPEPIPHPEPEKENIDMAGKPPKKQLFTKPTADEVKAYIIEKGVNVDADSFIDHYESNGWMVGKVKMKDWRATVRKWGRGNNGKPAATPQQTKSYYIPESERT